MTYCEFVRSGNAHPVHAEYHDHVYGFPVRDDAILFERLVLEINQAGLSWETILKKRANFRAAYDNFDIHRIAAYGDADVQRLLHDPGIIRNRLKIAAAIHNARQVQELQKQHGSFAAWLELHRANTKDAWVRLFKVTFRFTGGEITGEFLLSIGLLPGAHDPDCPVLAVIASADPAQA